MRGRMAPKAVVGFTSCVLLTLGSCGAKENSWISDHPDSSAAGETSGVAGSSGSRSSAMGVGGTGGAGAGGAGAGGAGAGEGGNGRGDGGAAMGGGGAADAGDGCPGGGAGYRNTCSGCVGLPCEPGRTCRSHIQDIIYGDVDCGCANGHMACCRDSHLVDPNGPFMCSFGSYPQPACPAALPTTRTPCDTFNVCRYQGTCCITDAFCDGKSWWVESCQPPMPGWPCDLGQHYECPSALDGGVRSCDCVASDRGPMWQCP
jgi:hypothetical protein